MPRKNLTESSFSWKAAANEPVSERQKIENKHEMEQRASKANVQGFQGLFGFPGLILFTHAITQGRYPVAIAGTCRRSILDDDKCCEFLLLILWRLSNLVGHGLSYCRYHLSKLGVLLE